MFSLDIFLDTSATLCCTQLYSRAGCSPPNASASHSLHSAESTKNRVDERFRCFLGLNKLSFIIFIHLVPTFTSWDIHIWILIMFSKKLSICAKFVFLNKNMHFLKNVSTIWQNSLRFHRFFMAFKAHCSAQNFQSENFASAKELTLRRSACFWVLINFYTFSRPTNLVFPPSLFLGNFSFTNPSSELLFFCKLWQTFKKNCFQPYLKKN